MLRVLLAAPLAAAVQKSNWAPGYRTAGNATTIDDGEAEETWAAYDHAYKAPNGWELQPFAYQNPERYTGWYADKRSKCKWSSPVSVFEHTKKYLRSTYGGAFTGSKWKSRNMYNQWSQSSLEATVCTQTWEQDGHKYQLDITRLGPIILNPGKIINTVFVPAAPLDDDMAYLVEAVDGYLDDNLKTIVISTGAPAPLRCLCNRFPGEARVQQPVLTVLRLQPHRAPAPIINERAGQEEQRRRLAPDVDEHARCARGVLLRRVDGVEVAPLTPSTQRALSVQTDRFPTQASTTTCTAATPI